MPDMRPEEILEIEADRRRRVTEAFRLGSEATTAGAGLSWLGPLAAGAAIAPPAAPTLGGFPPGRRGPPAPPESARRAVLGAPPPAGAGGGRSAPRQGPRP